MVTKGWLEQEAMLRHAAGRGAVPDPLRVEHFVTEATACGVPLLAWPRGADQRANATALESSGVRCGWSAMPKKKRGVDGALELGYTPEADNWRDMDQMLH
jgi:hypothetical protein